MTHKQIEIVFAIGLVIGMVIFLSGCTTKQETQNKCIDGHLYKVVKDTSYELIRKGGC